MMYETVRARQGELAEISDNSEWFESSESTKNVAGTALIGKACDILEIIGKSPGEVSQVVLAEKTGIPRATLYRIVAALTARGLIRTDPVTHNYTLGFNFLEFGQNAWSSGDLASIASVELRRLRDLTGETAYLAVQQGNQVLSLGRFESPHPQRSNARLGVLKPMHCTSQGKAILAHLPYTQLNSFLTQDLPAFTHRTITNPQQLKAKLAIIRSRGFSIDDEEIVLGTRCVGAPILDGEQLPVAAISVAAPTFRMTPERAEKLGFEIADIARRISSQLAPALAARHSAENHFTILTTNAAFNGGAPIWRPDANRLFWIDKLAPAVYGLGPEPFISLETLAARVEAACLIEGGALVSAGNQLAVVDSRRITGTIACTTGKRITALRVSTKGEIWAAALQEDSDVTQIGPLRQSGDVTPAFEIGGTVSDMCFRGEDELFVAVPGRSCIFLLEPATSRKRRFADIPKVAGMPTGLASDTDGGIWVAMTDGWCVLKLNENGEIVRTVAIPFPQPSGIAFGGPLMTELYVTSARLGLTKESLLAAPLSGHVVSIDVGLRGLVDPLGVWLRP